MTHDVRVAGRMLAKDRGATAVAVGMLAMAIGANTAIFSVLNSALLKLLPVRGADELVMLTDPNASLVLGGRLQGERSLLGYEEFKRLRDRVKTLTGVCAAQLQFERWPVRVAGGREEQARGRLVSENYFEVLGVQATAGRLFSRADEHSGRGQDPFAVISYNYWQLRFGGSPAAIGTTIRIRNAALTIAGVAARNFRGETVGQHPDVWVPLLMQPAVMPGVDGLHDFMDQAGNKIMWLHVFGRRKPGVSTHAVQAETNVLFQQMLATDYAGLAPTDRRQALDQTLRVRAVRSGAFHGREQFAEQWGVLGGLSALVLLIACANIANLQLARGAARGRETTIRLALGASRIHVVRQFLTESLLLAAAGGVAGVAVAAIACRVLPRVLARSNEAFAVQPAIDLRTLAFSAATIVLTAFVIGMVPAIRAIRAGLRGSLQGRARAASVSRERARFVNGLVIAQVAFSFLLVMGAGLFWQTMRNLHNVALGYPRQNLLLLDVDATGVTRKATDLDRELTERFQTIPGVRAVTYTDRPLLNGFDGSFTVSAEGFTSRKEADRGSTGGFAGPGYFSTMGMRLVKGREIGPQDRAGSERVCVINEAFARHFFGGQNAIGKHLTVSSGTMTIVGIVRDTRTASLRGVIEPKFYAAAAQNEGGFSFELRTAGDAARVMNAVRQSIERVDGRLTIAGMETLEGKIAAENAQPALMADISASFGGTALLLAAMGVYAVLANNVAQRRNEFGIRMALGAQERRITRMILGQSGRLIAVGLVAGLAGAAAAARLLATQLMGEAAHESRWSLASYQHVDSATQLYGIGALDLPTMTVTVCLLAAAGFLAAYAPALRAARTDPAAALRDE